MSPLENAYIADINKLTKVVALQRQIISNQERMIAGKDAIIAVITEQKEHLVKALVDINNHLKNQNTQILPSTDCGPFSLGCD